MKNSSRKKTGLALALLLGAIPGCVSGPVSDGLGPDQMAIEEKARSRYEQAVVSLGAGHYLLARQQFAVAATMAMSQQLHDDAVVGRQRADKIIAQQR